MMDVETEKITQIQPETISCYVCQHQALIKILEKAPTPVWHGHEDAIHQHFGDQKFKCILYQCSACGHIQQPIAAKLNQFLDKVYQSTYAQVSTELGVGNWGGRRAREVQQILSDVNLSRIQSALEIGCASGYFLRYLKQQGITDLMGIDPSLKAERQDAGITYRRDFVNAQMQLNRKFDLIFSLGGFEHIQDVNSIMFFVKNHLSDKGVLFFEIPNTLNELSRGDPAVFLHEHVHYFTENSLQVLAERNGLQVDKILKKADAFFVFVRRQKDVRSDKKYDINLYLNYQDKLNKTIQDLAMAICHHKIGFHGVSYALNNILGWANIHRECHFSLFDNDEMKIGKKYFGKTIHLPSRTLIEQCDELIIIPSAYFNEIKIQYQALGFKGNIMGVTTDE